MKGKTVLIKLDSVKIHRVRITATPITPPETPETPENPVDIQSAIRAVTPSLNCTPGLKASPKTGDNEGLLRFSPASVDFNVPDADMPRVRAWFTGNYSGVTQPPSDTLIRNVSNSVKDALSAYFNTANSQNLFTSPFRIGWAFRFTDGSRRMTEPMTLLSPNDRAPLLPITEYHFLDGGIRSTVRIANMPHRLTLTFSGNQNTIDWGDISHIDIVAAPQADLLPDTVKVTHTSGITLDQERYNAYYYDRPEASAIMDSASLQNDLRIIASIPVADISVDGNPLEVTLTPGALANWKLLPKYKTDTGGGNAGDENDPDTDDDPSSTINGSVWEPLVNVETEALDLGDMIRRKWLGSVQLHGRFERGRLKVSLFGARHRDDWRKVAVSQRDWIDGLHADGYRWWKVRITGEMRKGDFVDAISFLVLKTR